MRVKPSALALLAFALFFSCSDNEEPAPAHEIGNWDLVNYSTINLPDGFARLEEHLYDVSEINFGSSVLEYYHLEIYDDGTYTRELLVVGRDDPFEDAGEWSLEGSILEMDSENVDFNWEIQKNEDNELWLSQNVRFLLLPDAIEDTLSDEYINSITRQEYIELHSSVSLDLVYVFDRE